MENTLEVLTTRKSGLEVHRQWPDEVKSKRRSETTVFFMKYRHLTS